MDYKIEQLRFQLGEDPTSRVFARLGEALRRGGEAEEAAEVLRRGLEAHPRYAAAWVSLGRALRDLDDREGAADAFGRVLELDATNLVAARAAGELAADRGDWAAAVAAFEVVREILPEDADAAARIAEAEARLAEEAAAREAAATPPPAEVLRLFDDDPFADAEPAGDPTDLPDDVFGEVAAAEAAVEEPAAGGETSELGGDEADIDGDEPDEGIPEAVDEPVFEEAAFEPPEPESWADLGAGDGDEGLAAFQVAPPEDHPGENDWLEAPEEPAPEHAAAEAEPEVPEFDEPIIEEAPIPPEEPEPESWSDVAAPGPDDLAGPPEPGAEAPAPEQSAAEAEIPELAEPTSDEAPGPAAELEPIIPETLADFDRPADEDETADDEPESVQPANVPLPTLTLARLALQQGDEELAEATLASLLEQDPGNAEAQELLAELCSQPRRHRPRPASAKVAALRGWLDTIRLASERQQT
jgi:tetratricopeptide (TPR) repeat protein